MGLHTFPCHSAALPTCALATLILGALCECHLKEQGLCCRTTGQDFFAEEERDTDWESSGDEVKDTVDSDFDKSVWTPASPEARNT